MNIFLAILLALGASFFRLVPHPANFTPIGALAMFLASRMPRKQAFAITFGAMFVSDIFIGFYDWKVMLAVYGSLALMTFAGTWMGKRFSMPRVAFASLGASTLFFLTTNFAVWAFSGMYAHTLEGLTSAYALAIPFFRNSALGDFFFSAVFFGAYEWVRKRSVAPPDTLPALSAVKITK